MISTSVGGVPSVVVIAFMPKEALDVAVPATLITRTGASEARALTLVEVVQLGLIWRWSRQKVVMSGEVALQSQEQGSSDAEVRSKGLQMQRLLLRHMFFSSNRGT